MVRPLVSAAAGRALIARARRSSRVAPRPTTGGWILRASHSSRAWTTPVPRCGAGISPPAPSWAAGPSARWPSPSGSWPPCWASACWPSPTPRGSRCRASRCPRTSTRSPTSCAATGSCWRCTRWPASPASSPAARCRCRPSTTAAGTARVHDHAGPLAIGFVVLATGFSLVTQALALGQGAATVSAGLQVSEPVLVLTLLPARPPGARRALPPARRLDRREPPRSLERAARGHAGHLRRGHPGAPGLGLRRGVRVAARAAGRLAGGLSRSQPLHFV